MAEEDDQPHSTGVRVALVTCRGYDGLQGLCSDDELFAQELKRRGFCVHVVEWESPWESGRFDVAIVRSTWNYIYNCASFLRWARCVEASGTKLFNSACFLEWNLCKLYLRELESVGVPILPTLWYVPVPTEAVSPFGSLCTTQTRTTAIKPLAIQESTDSNMGPLFEDLDALWEEIQSKGWTDGVVKPAVSNDAFCTNRVSLTDREALRVVLDKVRAHCPVVMVQPFMQEITTAGEWSFVFFGGQFSHVIKKLPAQSDFRVQHAYGGRYEAVKEPAPEAVSAAACVDHLLCPHLFSRIDMIPTTQGWLLSELEVIEPYLHFSEDKHAPQRAAHALVRLLQYGALKE